MARYAKKITLTYVGTERGGQPIVPQKIYLINKHVRNVKIFSSGSVAFPAIVGIVNDKLPTFSTSQMVIEVTLVNENLEGAKGSYLLVQGTFNEIDRPYSVSVVYDEVPSKRFHVGLFRSSLRW